MEIGKMVCAFMFSMLTVLRAKAVKSIEMS